MLGQFGTATVHELEYFTPKPPERGSPLVRASLICTISTAVAMVAFVVLDFFFERWFFERTAKLILPTMLITLAALAGAGMGLAVRWRLGETGELRQKRMATIAVALGVVSAGLGGLMTLGMWVVLYHWE